MSLMRKIAAAINPFFFHFTLPYTMATLIFLSMVGGFVGLLIVNLQCTTSTSTEVSVDQVFGSLVNMRIWVDTKLARPASLPETTTRKVEMCTTNVALPNASSGLIRQSFCMFPPNSVLAELTNFPSAVNWCTKEDIQSLGTDIPQWGGMTTKEITETGKNFVSEEGQTFFPALGEDDDMSTIQSSFFWTRSDFFGTGWCKNAGTYDAITGASTTTLPAAAATAMAQRCSGDLHDGVDTSFNGYNWCGCQLGKDGGSPLCGWDDWEAIPAGSFWYTHYFASRVTTTVEICPSTTVAATSAFGMVALIELVATIVFGVSLVKLGIAKPASGYQSSTAMTLLRGAGCQEAFQSLMEEVNVLKEGKVQHVVNDVRKGAQVLPVSA